MNCKSGPSILFVDDERTFCEPWVRALKSRFEVQYFRLARDFMREMDGVDRQVVLVLDVMMPLPQGGVEADTENSQITGIWLLRRYSEFLRRTKSAAVLFTNLDVRTVEGHLRQGESIGVPVQVLAKMSTTPGELLKVVETMARSVGADVDTTSGETNESDRK